MRSPSVDPAEPRRSYRRARRCGPLRGSRRPAPTESTRGARMNTARKGCSPTTGMSRSASKESTCRPKALRRTMTSRPPMTSWSGLASVTVSASMIIPAHDPYIGIPARRASRSGSRNPSRMASLDIVVDSPPGMTRPSIFDNDSTCRTGTARAPTASSDRMCSRTSPCNANTPTTGDEFTSLGLPSGGGRGCRRR